MPDEAGKPLSMGQRALIYGLLAWGPVLLGAVTESWTIFAVGGLMFLVCGPASLLVGAIAMLRGASRREPGLIPAIAGFLLGAAATAVVFHGVYGFLTTPSKRS